MGRPNKALTIGEADRLQTAGVGRLAEHAALVGAARPDGIAVGHGPVQSGSGAALRGQRRGG
jgi:hypothetical protein